MQKHFSLPCAARHTAVLDIPHGRPLTVFHFTGAFKVNASCQILLLLFRSMLILNESWLQLLATLFYLFFRIGAEEAFEHSLLTMANSDFLLT